MAWQDELLQGSFRGVPFGVRSHEAGFGRRLADHEYPKRDDPYDEDIGRKQREFTVDAWVIGDDYMRQRDALIEASEALGPGRLVHPYLGIKDVTCHGLRVMESVDEGRMARLSFTFKEAGQQRFPSASTDFLGKLGSVVGDLGGSAKEGFAKVFNVLGLPEYVATSAANVVKDLAVAFENIAGIANIFTDIGQAAKDLVSDAVDLVRSPAELADRIWDSIQSIGDIDFDLDSVSQAYKSLFPFGEDLPDGVAPLPLSTSRQQSDRNTRAIIDLVRQSAVSGAAIAAAEKAKNSPGPNRITMTVDTPLDPLLVSPTRLFPTYESALQEREDLFEVIEDQFERATDDAVYLDLQLLRNAIAQALPDEEADLPNLITLQNDDTQPSLAIAYEIYGHLDFEIDLIKRNEVEHPGFVPGGYDLQVIRNG